MSTQERYEFDVELIERELINVSLDVLDIAPSAQILSELLDIDITDPQNGQILRYNSTTEKWENVTLDIVIQENSVFNESPSKITSKQFQTLNNYMPGTLRVFLNGIKENYITEDSSNKFSFDIDTITSDIIEVNYIKDV